MRKIAKTLVATVLAVAVCSASLVAFASCNNDKKDKKAIIMVTALFSGGLYDKSTNEPVWDPLAFGEEVSFDEVMEVLGAGLDSEQADALIDKVLGLEVNGKAYTNYLLKDLLGPVLNNTQNNSNLLYRITLNEDGTSRDENLVPANNYNGAITYGVMQAYRKHVEVLNEREGEYEAVVFNYDWRLDGAENSRLLEEYINQNGYKEVVLMSHSLGGQVCSGYLARSAENRAKVQAYCPFSPAFLGAMMALIYLNNPWDVLDGFDFAALGEYESAVVGALDGIMNDQATPLVQNMTSIIQLLPSFAFCQKFYDEEGVWPIKDTDGNALDTEDKLFAYYTSRPWAWKTDGEGNYLVDNDGNHVLKDAVAGLREFQHSLYVDTNGDGTKDTFAPDLVNTYYFIGDGMSTQMTYDDSVVVENPQDSAEPNKYKTYGATTTTADIVREMENAHSGDGTVPYFSLLGAKTVKEINDLYNDGKEHVFVYSGKDHGTIGCVWNALEENVLIVLETIGW